jgi:type VI secretion system secreted protein Hcp
MAVVDYFLKIDGIEGESKDSKHKNEIEISEFTFHAHQAGTQKSGGGGGAGKVQMSDFSFRMHTSKASPKLMLACADGSHIKSAILTCRKAGKEQQEYLKYTFSDLLVSKWSPEGSSEDAHVSVIPTESISINFSKIEMEYKEQQPDGSLGGPVKAGYDLKAMKGV